MQTVSSALLRRETLKFSEALRVSTNSYGLAESLYPQSDWFSVPLARDKQLPPDGDWRIWLALAGRGWGKTRAITEWANEQARLNPGSRGALVARTAADVRDVLVEGESGILAVSGDGFRPLYEPSKRRLTYPNGSIATTFSADEPNLLRGPNFHWAICDELAAWQFVGAWDNLLMALRLGNDPRVAVATTPRPTPIIKSLLIDPSVSAVRGSTYENRENLAATFFSDIINRYEGTTLGRQELDGEVIGDVVGALWKRALIDSCKVSMIPAFKRVVVGIDPMGSKKSTDAEAGIVVAALGEDGHGYILDDASLKGSPDEWARSALTAYSLHKADRIVAEGNFGGDMVESTLRTVDRNVSIKLVTATRGKAVRAEPVAALYEQGKVHHVGTFAILEDEMCGWTVESNWSPNRLDALVWALTELMLGTTRRSAVL